MAGPRGAPSEGGAAPEETEGGASSDGRARPRGTAKDRALRLLGVRWRSREELRRRLLRAGFDPDEVDLALVELEAAGLVDDRRFAQEVARDRGGRRAMGDRAILAALRGWGVAQPAIDEALRALPGEGERAAALAERRAARMPGVSEEAATRRIYGMLVRRGFPPGVAAEEARRAVAGLTGDGVLEGRDPDPSGSGAAEP